MGHRRVVALAAAICGLVLSTTRTLCADPQSRCALEWSQHVSSEPGPDLEGTFVWDDVRRVLVALTTVGETWEWNGDSWAFVTDEGPGRRAGCAMAFDSQRNRVVLYGGYYEDTNTWEYDGSAWTLASSTGPPVRGWHSMVFDEARGVMVVFGGRDAQSTQIVSETWEWDGQRWVERPTAHAPSPREFFAMAYDTLRGRTVLFGGKVGCGYTPFGETWEYDGDDWRLAQSPSQLSPEPRFGCRLTFDVAREGCTLFGGNPEACYSYPMPFLGDTWTWDGSAWRQLSDSGPAPRIPSAMYFDSTGGRLWVHGRGLGAQEGHDFWSAGATGAPVILRQPADQSSSIGRAVVFHVEADGGRALHYQWFKNGAPVIDTDRVRGSSSHSLKISPAIYADHGTYHVGLENACGRTVSESVSLEFPFFCPGSGHPMDPAGPLQLVYVLQNWRRNWLASFRTGHGDYDGDGLVDFRDISAVILWWGHTCAPDP